MDADVFLTLVRSAIKAGKKLLSPRDREHARSSSELQELPNQQDRILDLDLANGLCSWHFQGLGGRRPLKPAAKSLPCLNEFLPATLTYDTTFTSAGFNSRFFIGTLVLQ